MHALKLKAHIDSSHRIEIQLPIDAPEGDAEVIVLIPDTPSPAEEGLRSFFDNLDRHSPQQRHSKEEIDAYLVKERASWD
jgi:hypothetical protein